MRFGGRQANKKAGFKPPFINRFRRLRGAKLMASAGFGLLIVAQLSACNQAPTLPKIELDVNPDIKAELIDYDYITAYGAVTRGLKQCWLADKKPLQKSEMVTKTNNKKDNKRADIFINGAAKKPKEGPRIISIHLVAKNETKTEVSVDNRLLDPVTIKQFKNDIRHFLKGGENCPAHKVDGVIEPKKADKKK